MMSLAERITLARGGDWHGKYGEIPALGLGTTDRSVVIRDFPSGGYMVFMKDGSSFEPLRIAISYQRKQWRKDDIAAAKQVSP